MREEKLRTHEEVLGELAEKGLDYHPLVWSCWGRPHAQAAAALTPMAAVASRRVGLAAPPILARRALALVGIQLVRRAVAMVAACVPSGASEDLAALVAQARGRRRAGLGRGRGPRAAGAGTVGGAVAAGCAASGGGSAA